MSTAEITAYLAGVAIGRETPVLTVAPEVLSIPGLDSPDSEVFQAWQRLGTPRFRNWVLRGVGDAWKQ